MRLDSRLHLCWPACWVSDGPVWWHGGMLGVQAVLGIVSMSCSRQARAGLRHPLTQAWLAVWAVLPGSSSDALHCPLRAPLQLSILVQDQCLMATCCWP